MKSKKSNSILIYIMTYIYLCLPVAIFLLGWCRWYIGVPIVLIMGYSLLKCIKERSDLAGFAFLLTREQISKLLLALLFIMAWVWLSGVGKFVWQNSDHEYRNTMYELLVTRSWPVIGEYTVADGVQTRGIVYYIGFWLPAALVGKIFGVQAGYVAQYIWAVLGIFLMYLLICIWRKKVFVWPLLLLSMFSGLDAIGTILYAASPVSILAAEHLERWPEFFQFSGMTTQLFWVFNQAIPAWIASALIFIGERPKNILFICSLIMLTSTLPFMGLLPYAGYYMVCRSRWEKTEMVRKRIRNTVENLCSFQNILGAGSIGIVCFLYLAGNISGGKGNLMASMPMQIGIGALVVGILLGMALVIGVLCLLIRLYLRGHRKIVYGIGAVVLVAICGLLFQKYLGRVIVEKRIYRIILLMVFYILETGVYLLCLYKKVEKKSLFWLNAIWLFMIPTIIIGTSIDFCMRASISGLFLIIIWCIKALDEYHGKLFTWMLVFMLSVGSVTSVHEIYRTVVNTIKHEPINNVAEEGIMTGGNFSGSTDSFYWEYISR